MSSAQLRAIDFTRHQRWLERTAGAQATLLIFDPRGECLWGERTWASEIGQTIARHVAHPEKLHRLDLNADKTALHQPLGLTQDGLLGWIAAVVDRHAESHPSPDRDGLADVMDDLAASIFEDCSQRHELEVMTEELGARYEELHLVYAVDHHLQDHVGQREALFQSLLQSTAEHLDVDVVAFVSPAQAICQWATSLSREIHNLDLVMVEMRGDLFRFLQASRETMVLNSREDPRRAYIFTDMPYKIIACPVRTQRRVEAVLVLLSHEHKPDFTNSDRKLAEVLANQLSNLSNTYLLLESMHEFNQQMTQALIEAVEAKDPYTRGHSERVNFLSVEIGRAMGLSPEDIEDLNWASLLHDVGKIGIPDSILCKPGRLTKDEYTFVMVHPERSYEILRHIRRLENALPGARHHQEKFDGTGYPHGLKGERIPLHARIIAVADTYDSITSSRAYRPGRTHEAAMAEIDRVAGTQCDPAIVAVFRELAAGEPEWLSRFGIRREQS